MKHYKEVLKAVSDNKGDGIVSFVEIVEIIEIIYFYSDNLGNNKCLMVISLLEPKSFM